MASQGGLGTKGTVDSMSATHVHTAHVVHAAVAMIHSAVVHAAVVHVCMIHCVSIRWSRSYAEELRQGRW